MALPQQPLDREPTQVIAGDSILFAKAVAGCSAADGWALAYRLFGPLGTVTPPAGSAIDVTPTVVAVGSGWTALITVAMTQAIVSDGSYRLVGRVTNAGTGEVRTVYDATLRILANPITATVASTQSKAEKIVVILDAAIEGRLTADLEHYQVDGKVVGKIGIMDLHRLRAKYAARVRRERHPTRSNPVMRVRF